MKIKIGMQDEFFRHTSWLLELLFNYVFDFAQCLVLGLRVGHKTRVKPSDKRSRLPELGLALVQLDLQLAPLVVRLRLQVSVDLIPVRLLKRPDERGVAVRYRVPLVAVAKLPRVDHNHRAAAERKSGYIITTFLYWGGEITPHSIPTCFLHVRPAVGLGCGQRKGQPDHGILSFARTK